MTQTPTPTPKKTEKKFLDFRPRINSGMFRRRDLMLLGTISRLALFVAQRSASR